MIKFRTVIYICITFDGNNNNVVLKCYCFGISFRRHYESPNAGGKSIF